MTTLSTIHTHLSSLLDPENKKNLGSWASTPDHFYVIVGCGFAAVLNHTTLRQRQWGRDRIANRKVIHIGFEDPWHHYRDHGLGQFPHLLVMPGYRGTNIRGAAETDGERDAPLRSTKLAMDTQHELHLLLHPVKEEPKPAKRTPDVFERLTSKKKKPKARELPKYCTDAEKRDGWVVVIQENPEKGQKPKKSKKGHKPKKRKTVQTPELKDANKTVRDLFKRYNKNVADADYKGRVAAALDKLDLGWKHGGVPYRLLVIYKDKYKAPDWLYADKIDICTGSGVIMHHSVPKKEEEEEKIVYEKDKLSYTVPPWIDPAVHFKPDSWARVVPAQHALFKNCWKAEGDRKRICLIGGGGVSVNICETLLHKDPYPPFNPNDTWLDWTARSTFQAVNIPDRSRTIFYVGGVPIGVDELQAPGTVIGINTNYDKPGGKTAIPNEIGATGCMIAPYAKRLRFVAGVSFKRCANKIKTKHSDDLDLARSEKLPETEVPLVTECDAYDKAELLPFPGTNNLWIPYYGLGNDLTLKFRPEWGVYEQVILNEGMVATANMPGTATFMTQGLVDESVIMDHEDRLVGIGFGHTDKKGCPVRILGQAGLTYLVEGRRLIKKETRKEYKSTDESTDESKKKIDAETALKLSAIYNRTFPEQARLEMGGFTFCALSIALANGYFDKKDHLNTNINTASKKDLKTTIDNAVPKFSEKETTSQKICDAIVSGRSDCSEGFMDWKELEKALEHLRITDEEKEELQDKLEYTYEPNPLLEIKPKK